MFMPYKILALARARVGRLVNLINKNTNIKLYVFSLIIFNHGRHIY